MKQPDLSQTRIGVGALSVTVALCMSIAGCAQVGPVIGFVPTSSIRPLTDAEREDIRRYIADHQVDGSTYLAVQTYDDRSRIGLMDAADAAKLESVRANAAAYRVTLQRQAAAEAERKAKEEKDAKAYTEWAASLEGRRQLAAQRIADAQRCITSWQATIDRQQEIGRASGVVDKQVLYTAGQMLVQCRHELNQATQACKAEKTC